MNFSDSVLIESKSVRDQGLSAIESKGLQQKILNKVKSALFALWRGEGYMTTKQVADYYEVPESTIRQNYVRCKAEFDADGVVKLAGEDLREVRDIMSLSSFTPQVTLFPPRAVIRMGFILKDSPVAAQFRTATLNFLQNAGEFISSEDVLNSLLEGNSPYRILLSDSQLKISEPLAACYDSISKKLKTLYKDGGIPGLSKDLIREKLAALSTYTKSWKLNTQQEIQFRLKNLRAKYPDLMTDVISIVVDGEPKTAVFMFQLEDMVISLEHVEECFGRQYLTHARNYLKVDYVYQFLVSPFGATPDASIHIERHTPSEMRGFVGVLTVKELAQFLRDSAWTERTKGLVKGEINAQFKQILDYHIPTDPLAVLLGLTF